MHYVSFYSSPLGKICLASDDLGLIGLWFEKAKYYLSTLDKDYIEKETQIIKTAKNWLNIYFKGTEPDFKVPLNLIGSDFRIKAWEILEKIPYGKVITYGEIAKIIAKQKGIEKMSSRAIGTAVGHNPISIIIPCHRVMGKNNKLTGYAAGIERKIKLLALEGISYL